MKKFPTLREFLLLQDPTYKYPRSIHNGNYPAEHFVELYDIAKTSWENFGDGGPPYTSKVKMLVAGHGGDAGVIRTLIGSHNNDPRFFIVARYQNDKDMISLVLKQYWWLQMQYIE